MKIVYYTSGKTGVGRLVLGLSIYNALVRNKTDCEYTILSSASPKQAQILDRLNVPHIEILPEYYHSLSPEHYEKSKLYTTLSSLNPDILIVDRMWLTLYYFIHILPCKKIFITSQVMDRFFTVQLEQEYINFKPEQYDRVITIEPFKCTFTSESINPMIIRNRDEILDRKTALNKLDLSGDRKVCFIGVNFKEGYLEDFKQKYNYLEDEYDVIYSTNITGGGIFPIVDYYNAIDLLICPPTYNHFWEAVYFKKEAIFETVPVKYCDLLKRIRECSEYYFDENGADQMVKILLSL
jgi:hypothetical protein